jgi:hypothetical protein
MSAALTAVSTWLTPTGFIQPDTPALRGKYATLRKAIEQELAAAENRALAIRGAHADLLNAQEANNPDGEVYVWPLYSSSIADLEAAFPELNLTNPTN